MYVCMYICIYVCSIKVICFQRCWCHKNMLNIMEISIKCLLCNNCFGCLKFYACASAWSYTCVSPHTHTHTHTYTSTYIYRYICTSMSFPVSKNFTVWFGRNILKFLYCSKWDYLVGQVCSVCFITLKNPKVHLHCLYSSTFIQQPTW